MELKFVSSKDIGASREVFKLYLYGIEMTIRKAELEQSLSSNCTFMELKCRRPSEPLMDKMFKLYLYGIEIWEKWKAEPKVEGSNCTFMELKWWWLR